MSDYWTPERIEGERERGRQGALGYWRDPDKVIILTRMQQALEREFASDRLVSVAPERDTPSKVAMIRLELGALGDRYFQLHFNELGRKALPKELPRVLGDPDDEPGSD